MENKIKKYHVSEIYKGLVIPETWDTLEDFVDWYMIEAKIPLLVPYDAEVVMSDDASAVTLFKKGPYQVELYLLYPDYEILEHSHPDLEVIIVDLGGCNFAPKSHLNTSDKWGYVWEKLLPGNYHGNDHIRKYGAINLAFEKWIDTSKQFSAASNWRGFIRGSDNHQANLIRRINGDDVFINDEMADVTKKI